MKYVFAGDRDISLNVLNFFITKGFYPEALFVTKKEKASHAGQLIKASKLHPSKIFEGNDFRSPKALELLSKIKPDYIFGIHFPYIIPSDILEIPKVGFLNLHPAYLPYNRGWHTPSWAIEEKTPIGATLHFMNEKLDLGDIVARKEFKIMPYHTANDLYVKLKQVEFELIKDSFDSIINLNLKRLKQNGSDGTMHVKKDLYKYNGRNLQLDKTVKVDDLLATLRAFSTNDPKEAAYFYDNGKKYAVQVTITPITDEEDGGY